MIHVLQNFAQSTACNLGNHGFFNLPTWYKYLDGMRDPVTHKCEVQFSLISAGKFNGDDILAVILAIIDMLIRIAALAAVAYVMYGGIKYITSQGSPDATKGAQNTIQHALLGLIITIVAAAFVSFLGSKIK
jgi:hypothetical protein